MADPNFLSSWSPRRRSRWVLYGFLLVATFYLLLEHTAHTLGALPFLVLLACPLMHLFMHRGHGHGHPGAPEGADLPSTPTPKL
jgi:hypothetical protein